MNLSRNDCAKLMAFIEDDLGLSFDATPEAIKAIGGHMGWKPYQVRRALRVLKGERLLFATLRRRPRVTRWHVVAKVVEEVA